MIYSLEKFRIAVRKVRANGALEMSEQALTGASRQMGTGIPINAENLKSLKHESAVAEQLVFRFPANLPIYVSGLVMSDEFLSSERKCVACCGSRSVET